MYSTPQLVSKIINELIHKQSDMKINVFLIICLKKDYKKYNINIDETIFRCHIINNNIFFVCFVCINIQNYFNLFQKFRLNICQFLVQLKHEIVVF